MNAPPLLLFLPFLRYSPQQPFVVRTPNEKVYKQPSVSIRIHITSNLQSGNILTNQLTNDVWTRRRKKNKREEAGSVGWRSSSGSRWKIQPVPAPERQRRTLDVCSCRRGVSSHWSPGDDSSRGTRYSAPRAGGHGKPRRAEPAGENIPTLYGDVHEWNGARLSHRASSGKVAKEVLACFPAASTANFFFASKLTSIKPSFSGRINFHERVILIKFAQNLSNRDIVNTDFSYSHFPKNNVKVLMSKMFKSEASW